MFNTEKRERERLTHLGVCDNLVTFALAAMKQPPRERFRVPSRLGAKDRPAPEDSLDRTGDRSVRRERDLERDQVPIERTRLGRHDGIDRVPT